MDFALTSNSVSAQFKTSVVYIVAGPRACGKSTFIEHTRRQPTALPVELQGIAQAAGPVYYAELARVPDNDWRGASGLLVHVDLVTPFAHLADTGKPLAIEALDAQTFTRWPGAERLEHCSELHVLTLRIPRSVTLQRWRDRCAARGRPETPFIAAELYGGHDDARYDALYAAWDRYVGGLRGARRWEIADAAAGGAASGEPQYAIRRVSDAS